MEPHRRDDLPAPTTAARAAALRALHHQPGEPLILPNAWDAASARAIVAAGFPAVATASHAVAAALGYEDGERAPRDEFFAAIGRVVASVDVPVSADVESGYGLPAYELVGRLGDLGAAGCNVEDSDPRTGELRPVEEAAQFVADLRAAAGDALVVNARTDVFLDRPVDDGSLADALARCRAYADAGADCVYPIGASHDALRVLTSSLQLPVNALSPPDPDAVTQLCALGVRRITFGPGLLRVALASVDAALQAVRRGARTSTVLRP